MDTFGATVLIGFSILLGLNQALVKLVNAGLSPLMQGGLRSAFALIIILAWAAYARFVWVPGAAERGLVAGASRSTCGTAARMLRGRTQRANHAIGGASLSRDSRRSS